MPLGKSVRPFKKARFVKRKRRGGRSSTYTSKMVKGNAFGFKTKRISRRSWNHKLWDSTLQKQHYRSVRSDSSTVTTSALASEATVLTLSAINNSNNFWLAAGGAISVDTGIPVPLFQDDITLRGGTVQLTISNTTANTEQMKFTVYLVKTGVNGNFGLLTSPQPILFDPSLIVDFTKNIGSIKLKREFIIENNVSMVIDYRLPIQKIDQGQFASGLHVYSWIILYSSPCGGAVDARWVRSHNLSFSADAIGTT